MPLKEWLDRPEVTRGRHGLSEESVRYAQRGRLLAATAELAAQHGVRGVTAARLTDRAGVSRATLYGLFESKDDCVHAAATEALESLGASISEAARSDRTADGRLEEMVDRFTGFCAEHPNAAQLGLVKIAGSGEEGAQLRNRAFDATVESFRDVLSEAYPAAPTLMADLFAGGLWHIAGSRLRDGRGNELPVAGRIVRARLLSSLRGAAARAGG